MFRTVEIMLVANEFGLHGVCIVPGIIDVLDLLIDRVCLVSFTLSVAFILRDTAIISRFCARQRIRIAQNSPSVSWPAWVFETPSIDKRCASASGKISLNLL